MTIEAEEGWQRLHPLTVLKELGSLAWTLVVLLVLDFEPVSVPGNNVGPEAVAAAAVFGYAVLRYLFTTYRITDQSLELRRGVLVRSYQVMPRDRVQSVTANTSFVGRLVGVTTVEVSAADAEDIQLGFVSEESGEALRRILEAERAASPGAEEADRTYLSEVSPRELFTLAATDTTLIAAGALLLAGGIAAAAFGWLLAPFGVVFLLIWPVMRTLRFVGFRSWVEEDRLRAEAGILGRRRSESPLGRIQVVQAVRPPLRRLVGMETVSIVTGDVGVSQESVQIAGSVAPLEPMGSWRRISEELIGRVALEETGLRPSSRRTIRRAVVRGLAVLLLVLLIIGPVGFLLGVGWWPAVAAGLLGVPSVVLYARARWRVLGWAVDDRHLLVRRGVLIRRLHVVPIHKVQDVTLRATFFQSRLDVASVEVDTAGVMLAGRVMAIDLETSQAEGLAEHLASVAARVALPDGV